ncbi:hypothetical protein L914_05775, partial [Phytophthora nicotianae]
AKLTYTALLQWLRYVRMYRSATDDWFTDIQIYEKLLSSRSEREQEAHLTLLFRSLKETRELKYLGGDFLRMVFNKDKVKLDAIKDLLSITERTSKPIRELRCMKNITRCSSMRYA